MEETACFEIFIQTSHDVKCQLHVLWPKRPAPVVAHVHARRHVTIRWITRTQHAYSIGLSLA